MKWYNTITRGILILWLSAITIHNLVLQDAWFKTNAKQNEMIVRINLLHNGVKKIADNQVIMGKFVYSLYRMIKGGR